MRQQGGLWMFVFQYSLTENDYVAFNEYHMAYSPATKINRWVLRLMGPILFLLLFFIMYIIIDDPVLVAVEGVVLPLIFSVLWMVFYRKIIQLQIRGQVKRLAKAGKMPFNREITLHFDENAFIAISPDTETKSSYTIIERIITGKYIYIYIGSMQAYIIPAYVFQNEEHWSAFFMFLQTKTSAPVISMPS